MKTIFSTSTLILYAIIIFSTIGLITLHFYIRNSITLEFYNQINNKVKSIAYGSIIKKYQSLFLKNEESDSDVSDFIYIDRLIRLRSQLGQILDELPSIDMIVYNYQNKIIYSNLDNKNNQNFSRIITLTHKEITKLQNKSTIYYKNNNGEFVTLFKVSGDYPIFLKIIQRPNLKLVSVAEKSYDMVLVITGIFLIIFAYVFYKMRNYTIEALNKQYELNHELEKSKELAEKENMSKSGFIANVSHELRTPLNAIIGFSEILINDFKIKDKQNIEYLNEIYNAGSDLLKIINDILDFSKAAANKLSIEIIEFDLSRIIKSCIKMLSQTAKLKKIELIFETSGNEVNALGDPQRMKQVMINIINNALKFTESGSVVVRATKHIKSSTIEINVIDTGSGIEPENIYKVLSPFGQEDSQNSRKYAGTGLGLPLSKKLIELMDGELKIESEKHKGTTITLIIPIAESMKEF